MFDVFPTWNGPFDDTRSLFQFLHFNQFSFKNIDFCTFTQKTRLVKENYF